MNSNTDLQNLLLTAILTMSNNVNKVIDVVSDLANTVKNSNKRILEPTTNDIPLKKIREEKSIIRNKNVTKNTIIPITKNNNDNKELNIIWARISTQNQTDTLSIQQQIQTCQYYLKTNNMTNIDTVVFTIVGSGYNIKGNVQCYLDKINEYLENNYKVNLICYMSDRFLRNFSIASNYINNIINHNGSIHVIRDINNKHIIVNNINNINNIRQSLLNAENESQIKSQRMKDIYKTKFDNNITESYSNETFKNIIKFINIFLHGGPVNKINNIFKQCIDWKSHPTWIKDYYENPIYYNESNITNIDNITYFTKNYNKDDTDNRINSIARLFNEYEINIPDNFKPKTKWDSKFIKKITEYNIFDISDISDSISKI